MNPPVQPELSPLPYERLLGAKQVGAEFGVSEDAVLAWVHHGLPRGCGKLPEKFIRRRGFKDFLFHPAVLDYIRRKIAGLR